MGIGGNGPCVRRWDSISRRFLDADSTWLYDPRGRAVSLFDVQLAAHPERPRFVVVRNSDDEIIAASNDPEAARAAARLLSL